MWLLLAWRVHEDIHVEFSWSLTNVSRVCACNSPTGWAELKAQASQRQPDVSLGDFLFEGSSHCRNTIPPSKNKDGHHRSWWFTAKQQHRSVSKTWSDFTDMTQKMKICCQSMELRWRRYDSWFCLAYAVSQSSIFVLTHIWFSCKFESVPYYYLSWILSKLLWSSIHCFFECTCLKQNYPKSNAPLIFILL